MNDNVVQLPGTVRREQGPRRFVPPPVVVDWAARRRRGLANLAAMSGDRHKLQALTDETLRKIGPDATNQILEDCLAYVKAMTPDDAS